MMIDLDELKRLAGLVTPGEWAYVRNPENTRWIIDSEPARAIACTAGYEPDNEANAALICLLRNALPTIIAALEVVALVRDEEWLAERISDSLDVDWRPIDAARAIVAALPKEPDNG